jgi:hypothetical protein
VKTLKKLSDLQMYRLRTARHELAENLRDIKRHTLKDAALSSLKDLEDALTLIDAVLLENAPRKRKAGQ